MGRRTTPHTADIRIEAWAPSREECIAEAVVAMVESFAESPPSPAEKARRAAPSTCRLARA